MFGVRTVARERQRWSWGHVVHLQEWRVFLLVCLKAKIALFYQISYLGYISCQQSHRVYVDV